MTESEALRALDLPSSRRQWLREQLPSVPVGGILAYEREAVLTLKSREAASTSTRNAEPAPRPPVPLHTR